MPNNPYISKLCWIAMVFVYVFPGCQANSLYQGGWAVEPLGTTIDQIHRQQEKNADDSKFTVYMHEFEINEPAHLDVATPPEEAAWQTPRGYRLNAGGQNHVRQIAFELIERSERGEALPAVIVEMSMTSKLQSSLHKYPVHPNHQLDQIRRKVIVMALEEFGITNAEELVVVASAPTTGLAAQEAAAAHRRATNQFGARLGGFSSSFR